MTGLTRTVRRARLLTALGAASLALVVGLGGVQGTSAYFTDTATIATTGGIFGGKVVPPTGVACSTAGGTYIRWTPATGNVPNTGWRVAYTNTTTGVTNYDNSVPLATTQWRPAIGSTVTYTVAVASTRGNWVSTYSSTAQIRVVVALYSCP